MSPTLMASAAARDLPAEERTGHLVVACTRLTAAILELTDAETEQFSGAVRAALDRILAARQEDPYAS